MERDLGKHRKVYQKSELTENTTPDNPMELFQKWFFEAEESNTVEEANAMTIATIGLDGFPKNRVIL